MHTDTKTASGRSYAGVSGLLFLSLFAAQAGTIALSPVLTDAARDLDVSTAAAGQTRTVAGFVAAFAAMSVSRLSRRVSLRDQLLAGATLVALGSLASAGAPSFPFLVLAQVPVGAGVGVLTTSGTLAAAAWVAPELRAKALSWALIGQPAAWIVGMPLIGLVGATSWRYGWLVLPFAGAAVASLLLARRRGSDVGEHATPAALRGALQDADVRRWFIAEVLANTAWAGVLIYAGALFVESYDAPTPLTGVILAVGAGAYVLGNMALRGRAGNKPRGVLVVLLLLLAFWTGLFGVVRPSIVVSTLLFSAAAFAAGGRTLVSSAFAVSASPELRPALVGARAASMQAGYFAGALLTGAALAAAGYAGLGLVASALCLGGAALLAGERRGKRGIRGVVASNSSTWSFGYLGLWRSWTAPLRWRSQRGSRGLSSPSSC